MQDNRVTDYKAMETNEDVLVVLDAESGEQIALPLSSYADEVVVAQPQKTDHKKQKRKEPLVVRPLDEVEMKLEIIEEPLSSDKIERKPRKKYRSKTNIIEPVEEKKPEPQLKPRQIDKPSPTPSLPPTERRTRLSNSCRVATGRSYKCKDCEFSTDRINNIITHIKESCKLKKEQV